MPLRLTGVGSRGLFAYEHARKGELAHGKAAQQLVAERANHGMGR